MRILVVIISLFVLLPFASCDVFDLLDQFERNGGLGLDPSRTTITQGETIDLNPVGGTAPYTFIVSEEDIYNGSDLGSVTNQQYTAGNSVGKIRIRIVDQDSFVSETSITVLPVTPSGFSGTNGSSNRVDLSWTSYSNASFIGALRIEFSTNNVSFTAISPTLSPSDISYSHTGLTNNQTYYYRLYAVAGSYESSAALTNGTP